MTDKLIIEGVEVGIDGEYDFDLATSFTGREIHIIKRIAGVRLLDIEDALTHGDHDLFLALGVICLRRHGKTIDEDKLWDAPAGCVRYVAETEADASPPAQQPEDERPNSGDASKPGGDGSQTSSHQNGSGSQASATGAAYVQQTSTT